MCDFISWVENEKGIFFLTDKEIFGVDSEFKLKGCVDNDFIGHGSIEKYFRIKGTHKEVKDFWNYNKLPEPLKNMVMEFCKSGFKKNWGKTFKKYFMNDDLRYIIEYAPEKYKGLAAKQLLTQNPSNDDLRYIIIYAPEKYKGLAWKQLLTQNPSNDDLSYIIICAPEKYKELAKLQLKF